MMPIRAEAVDEQGFSRFLVASCIKRRQGSKWCPTSSPWAREFRARLKYPPPPGFLKTESAYSVAGGDVYLVWHSIFFLWGVFFDGKLSTIRGQKYKLLSFYSPTKKGSNNYQGTTRWSRNDGLWSCWLLSKSVYLTGHFHEELLSLTPHLVDEDPNFSLMRAPSLEEVKNVVFGLSSNS